MNQVSKKTKQIRIIYISSIVIIAALIAFSFFYSAIFGIERLGSAYVRDVSIDITAMVFCGVLIFSIALDRPWDKQNRTLFRLIFTLCLLFHFDAASSFMESASGAGAGVMTVNTLLLICETLLIYCFWSYVREELRVSGQKEKIANLICKVILFGGTVADLINIKYGYFFTVDSSGKYVAGRLEIFTELSTIFIYAVIAYVIISEKEHPVREKIILITFQLFPLIAHTVSMIRGEYSSVFPAYLLAVMLIYINIFSNRSKKILEQKVELDGQRQALMISQIQPHFLYNVLTTISNLCVTDPEEAEETTVLFAQYLRTNLDSLRKTETVPFSEELRHINTYVELEKKRFGEKLNVETDIRDAGFKVPALGLQPIVENSIKHGIRGKDTPGHLFISSCKVDGGYEVVIQDDGVGFDPKEGPKEDGRSHVGMINVRSRLEQMCGAEMTVESSPGNGCKTTVFFPEK